jgi:large subunit ribosomal protein L21
MPMYAIIETGGKQYRVEPGMMISVEKIEAEPGSQIELSQVLMLRTDEGAACGHTLCSRRQGDGDGGATGQSAQDYRL